MQTRWCTESLVASAISFALSLLFFLALPFSANAQGGITSLPDLDGDGRSDLLWHNPANWQSMAWFMNGVSASSSVALLGDPAWTVIKTAELDGDGRTDLILYNESTGQTVAWIINGTSASWTLMPITPGWKVTETADLNGDGKTDLLWYNASTGQTVAWIMNGSTATSSANLIADADWQIIATADLNGDRTDDLIWSNTSTGQTAAWLMNGTNPVATTVLLTASNWKVIATADFNGDHMADLLWYNVSNGLTAMSLMSGTSTISWTVLPTDSNWKVAATGDLNGDRKAEIILSNATTGQKMAWLMDGTSVSESASLLTSVNWNLAAAADLNNDGKMDLLWYNAATGQTAAWLMSGTSAMDGANLFTDASWRLKCIKAPSVTIAMACDDSVPSRATGTMPANQAPIANAGTDQSVTLPAVANLAGISSDDGAPIALLVSTWSQVSGAGTVTFGNTSSPTTTASFSSPGSYTLRLTVRDTSLIATDDVIITVAAPVNQAPIVNSGPDQVVTYPSGALLAGSATDDGLPTGTLNRTWTKVTGPGTVAFLNLNSLNTSATFSMAGSYTLRLTVSDGVLSANDDVIITVNFQQSCGDVVSGTLTLSVNATDNVGVDGVQLKLDGANLGAELKTVPYSIPWNTTTALNGCHTLSAVARDAAGNQGSTSLQVTVLNAVLHQEIVVTTEKTRTKNAR